MYFSLYFIGENMDKDKKIEIQQQELLRLDKENEELNQQIVELNDQIAKLTDELTIEKNKPKEGYEQAKRMMVDLEDRQEEFINLISELSNLKLKYEKEILKTQNVREEYQDKIVSAMWDMKHAIETM
jgi:chromosome segregation ATPase